MALFSGSKAFLDFSYDLRDKRSWNVAIIREVEYLSDGMSAFATDSTNGLLAVGTKGGKIIIFSSPPAAIVVRVPSGVKFLSFAALVFKLICIDDRDTLHVWDLSQLGRPKLLVSQAYREPISCITTSPYHSHAFIGLERGTVATFDILCLNRSPYRIPHSRKSPKMTSFNSAMYSHKSSDSSIMEIVVHPRDLNLLFICYTDGVVLYDLIEHRALHHYELIIPPGAPGALGYHDSDVMKPRQPSLTSIAVHASGQLFVTGHIDGTLAFWAVIDEDRPLMVRTIDEVDIDYPDGEKLDLALSEPEAQLGKDTALKRLEPIFKLSWSSFGSQSLSDPYAGDTSLTILGGVQPDKQTGVTVLHLPPIALPSASSSSDNDILPETRRAITASFSSVDKYFYFTAGPAIDFLLVPKEEPHFGGNLDPGSILIIYEWPGQQRSMVALEFPPPVFRVSRTGEIPASASQKESKGDLLDKELSSTLKAISLDDDPKDYSESLPPAFWTGVFGLCDGDIVRLENEGYESLQQGYHPSRSNFLTRLGRNKVAGTAWVDYAGHDQSQDVLFTKRQPHKFLVTHHRDLTIRFQDISPQLLLGTVSEPLLSSFPAPLPHLTISLSLLLAEPCISGGRRPLHLADAEVQSAHLTSESKECTIVMRSGHVFVYGFDSRQRHMSNFSDLNDDIIRLMHIPAEANTFQPTLMVENAWGPVTVAEMSDIGFLAIAYRTGSLVVVDMRQPKILLRDEIDAKSQKRLSKALSLHGTESEKQIVSLQWFVCGYDEDTSPKVRLVVCHRSGHVRIITLSRSASQEWTVENVHKLEGVDGPLPRGAFVLQAKTGANRTASRTTFKEALQGGPDPSLVKTQDLKDEGAHCFWVSTGEKGAKCNVNFTGGKAGKVDWGRGRKIECVQVVSRDGSHALVAVMQNREVIIYSLPALELIHTFQLSKRPNSVICMDDTGDFVDWTFDERGESIVQLTMGTLFAIRRVFDEPVVDFTVGRRYASSMPPAVPLAPIGYIGSWLNFKKGMNGDAIDEILAGPDRPIPQDVGTSGIVNRDWQAQAQSRAQEIANQASQAGASLYANLTAAVSERGDALNGLQEQFNSLESGGRKMMLEAKKLAAEQTGKRWFNF